MADENVFEYLERVAKLEQGQTIPPWRGIHGESAVLIALATAVGHLNSRLIETHRIADHADMHHRLLG